MMPDRATSENTKARLFSAAGEVAVGDSDLPRRDIVPDLGVPAELLMRRPDLRRAERARVAAEREALLRLIDLSAALGGGRGTDANQIAASR